MGRAASRRFVNDVAVEAELFDRATNICLALPEATADDRHPPHRGFLVGKKNFAWFVVDEHGDGRIGLGVRAAHGENEELVASDPERPRRRPTYQSWQPGHGSSRCKDIVHP
jgi:hypothetical protein